MIRASRVVAVSCMAIAFGMTGTASAAAIPNTPGIEYRVGDSGWQAAPPALFPADWRAVPGGTIQVDLGIRSTRRGATIVALYAGPADSDSGELLDAAMLRSGDTEIPLGNTSKNCTLLSPQRVLQQGQELTTPLSFTINQALDTAQATDFSLDILVSLSDTGPRVLANGCPVAPEIIRAFPVGGDEQMRSEPGALSATGSESPAWWWSIAAIGAGAMALAIGLIAPLLRRGRNSP